MQIKHLENFITVKSLRKYFKEMESKWDGEDKKFLGEFENIPIRIEYHNLKGIGDARIIYDGGLGFILLEIENKND